MSVRLGSRLGSLYRKRMSSDRARSRNERTGDDGPTYGGFVSCAARVVDSLIDVKRINRILMVAVLRACAREVRMPIDANNDHHFTTADDPI